MILNGLKLNEEKTELLLLSSRYRPSPSLEFVRVGSETIQAPLSVQNLMVLMVIEDFLPQDLSYGTAYPPL